MAIRDITQEVKELREENERLKNMQPTLRDQWAMRCPQEYIDNHVTEGDVLKEFSLYYGDRIPSEYWLIVEARTRYRWADAMLAEREKK